MNKGEFAKKLEQAASDGTLVTEKHDPSKLSTTHRRPRTVIAAELAPDLPVFFKSLDFDVTHYENTNYPQTPDLWEIAPKNPTYSVPASGVPPNSPTPSSQCDRLVVVSGAIQGLHIFGESHAALQRQLASGQLRNPQVLR